MKKNALLVLASLMLSLGLVTAARADNGPHGGYTNLTDKCAGCHRAHTAVGANLLAAAASPTDKSVFCYTCHSGGLGAYTDVKNGLFLTGATGIISGQENTYVPPGNTSLKGGGFVNVRMNPDLTGAQTLSVTSSHMVTGGSNKVWGFGAITSTVDAGAANVSMTCTNCHNPHGGAGAGNTATYRLLKGNNASNTPLFANDTVTKTADYTIPDETTKYYNVDYGNDGNYWAQHGSEGSSGPTQKYAALTSWCAQCHARYLEPMSHDPANTNSGDAVFQFRHGTNDTTNVTSCLSCHWGAWFYPPAPGCITCHVAHGTGARMGTYSGTVPWPDGATAPNSNGRSALLRLDNRGVCQQCHQK
ncbi:MAG: hypothetical protein M1358_22580 [Chloroflexi bacterium]|nr:hypothetical protein [Chloroflexota bacterium]